MQEKRSSFENTFAHTMSILNIIFYVMQKLKEQFIQKQKIQSLKSSPETTE